MTETLGTEQKDVEDFIDHLSHVNMAWLLRFSESGHPFFDSRGPYHIYFVDRFQKHYGGMTPAISKEIGHNGRAEVKTDILLESRDEGLIGLWLIWSATDVCWYIHKWVAGYTMAVSMAGWFSWPEGIAAWVTGVYQLRKVDGAYSDG
jgi:hypothetical protein